jgi:Na+/proline symporter
MAVQFFMPWWIIAPVAFGLAFWKAMNARQAFIAGFAGIALGWLGYSLFIHLRTEGVLTQRIAHVLPLHHSFLLILVTVLIGGLVGGMAALAGYYCRNAFLGR